MLTKNNYLVKYSRIYKKLFIFAAEILQRINVANRQTCHQRKH